MGKRIAVAFALIGAMVLILTLYLPRAAPPMQQGMRTTAPLLGGPFTLTDSKGNPVTETVLKGRHSLVFFGFTHCPDICPLTLQMLSQALELAPAADVQGVFITVDPERDTPEALAAYMTSFSPRFVALTGTPEQVTAATKAYRVFAEKAPLKDSTGKLTGDYTMNHSGAIFLMDKEGRFLDRFDKDAGAETIAARLRAL